MGEYHLYGWVPGVLGDYKLETAIIVSPGLYFTSKHNVMFIFCSMAIHSIPFVNIGLIGLILTTTFKKWKVNYITK